MRILAVSVSPNTDGLPGLTELAKIVGALLTIGALACVAGVVVSAVVAAMASHGGNAQVASRAKVGVLVCFLAALLVGGASILITFFLNAGQAL